MKRPDKEQVAAARATVEDMLSARSDLDHNERKALETLVAITTPVSAREVYALADQRGLDVHSMETALRKFFVTVTR